MGALKFLFAVQKKTGEQREPIEKCLMYVEAWVNHKLAKSTMVDSGTTHNFMTETEANRLNIKWHRDLRKMKVANSVALPILGIARKTTIKFGTLSSLVDFVIVKMDDFDVVLGMKFLLEHKVISTLSRSLRQLKECHDGKAIFGDCRRDKTLRS